MREIWKEIRGFKGYEVSNLGKVRSTARIKQWGNTFEWKDEIMLKQVKGKNGYLYVNLYNKGRFKKSVHNLVIENFVGLRPKDNVINHRNGDKENNNVTNLEYCTQSYNMKHAYDNGLYKKERVREYNKRVTFGKQ
jgi:hypothetical protein